MPKRMKKTAFKAEIMEIELSEALFKAAKYISALNINKIGHYLFPDIHTRYDDETGLWVVIIYWEDEDHA
jgi:hypothetical protein